MPSFSKVACHHACGSSQHHVIGRRNWRRRLARDDEGTEYHMGNIAQYLASDFDIASIVVDLVILSREEIQKPNE